MKVFSILSDKRAFSSRAPIMFTRVFKRIGIRAVYVPFNIEPQNIGQAMQAIRVLNIDGANMGAPYKEAVLPHMDILSEGANIIGAVNTVIRNKDQLKGYNTNAIGFMDTLEEAGFEVSGKTALIFGAEGSAKAVIFILNWLRAGRIHIAGQNMKNLKQVTQSIGGEVITLDRLRNDPPEADIIINASSASSPGDAPAFAGFIKGLACRECRLVVDLNYGHPDNFWKEMAAAGGIPFIDGLTPLAHSARKTMLLWTRVDVEPMEFIRALND